MNILSVLSSANGEASNSIRLSNAIVESLKAKYPGSTEKVRNLVKDTYPHLEESHVEAFFAPIENTGHQYDEATKHSDEALQELTDADIIVIGVPMYNFGIPSALKAWIDHVVRLHKTFEYDSTGQPKGIVQGKKMYLAIASGGIYSEGLMKAYDFTEPYLRAIFGFIGITDVTTFRSEGVAIPGMKESALKKGIDSIVV